ncbi:MAG: hypothetical protein MI673_04060 [Thiotrichales bacterium]|nr:hypothetical protein [Thiotrichales bacterium]
MLDPAVVDQREEALRQQVNGLDDRQRKAFYTRFDACLKDPDTYAVLNYLFIAGLHHFYLGKWLRGMINLTVFTGGVICLLAGFPEIGIGLLVLITVVELYALFRSQLIVKDHNNRQMQRILGELTD